VSSISTIDSLPSAEGDLIEATELRTLRASNWAARSARGVEILDYDHGFQVLEHPGLEKGPSFQRRLDQLGMTGEARRFFDMGVPNTEGEYRKKLRGPLGALFRPTQVAKLRDGVRSVARAAVDELDASGPVDLLEKLCWTIPSRTYCDLVSIPHSKADEVASIAKVAVGPLLTGDTAQLQSASDAVLEAVDLVREHLAAKRANPGDDFTSVMIRQQEKGLLTEDELFAEAFSILMASVDNTTHQMASVFGVLLTDRSLWQAFLNDRELRAPLIEEVIRLYPRFGTVFRYARNETVVDDLTVPADTWVFVSTRAGQRDPAVYEQPDEFRIDRPVKRPPMFGAGPYNCLGQNLARMEIEEAMLAVADRYPEIALAEVWTRSHTNAVTETSNLVVTLA
jgi:cytochrome P450